MNTAADRIREDFQYLADLAEKIVQSKASVAKRVPSNVQYPDEERRRYASVSREVIDDKLVIQWKISVARLLHQVFGPDHPTFTGFKTRADKAFTSWHQHFDGLHAVFLSAHDDFRRGCLFNVRGLIQSEVFATQLDQVDSLLASGSRPLAVALAGMVLETTLRELSVQHSVPIRQPPSINKLNEDLRRAGAYGAATADSVVAWGKTRNNAMHGRDSENTDGEVKTMLVGVRAFVESLAGPAP